MAAFEFGPPEPPKRQELCRLILPSLAARQSSWPLQLKNRDPAEQGLGYFNEALWDSLQGNHDRIRRATCRVGAAMVYADYRFHIHPVFDFEWRLGVMDDVTDDLIWQQPMLNIAAAMADRVGIEHFYATLTMGEKTPCIVELYASGNEVKVRRAEKNWVSSIWPRRYAKKAA